MTADHTKIVLKSEFINRNKFWEQLFHISQNHKKWFCDMWICKNFGSAPLQTNNQAAAQTSFLIFMNTTWSWFKKLIEITEMLLKLPLHQDIVGW